jgi:hypothetical protein
VRRPNGVICAWPGARLTRRLPLLVMEVIARLQDRALCASVTCSLPTLSLPTAAPVDRAPRTERPVLAHTVGALRSHRGYLSADMGTKVMSAAARWLLLCPSGRARLPQTDQRCWIGYRGANRLMLTTPECPDLRALRKRRGTL